MGGTAILFPDGHSFRSISLIQIQEMLLKNKQIKQNTEKTVKRISS